MAHSKESFESFLSGGNIDFIEGLYARFLEDPSSIDPSWRELFEGHGRSGKPIFVPAPPEPKLTPGGKPTNGANGKQKEALTASKAGPVLAAVSSQSMGLQAKVDQTVYAFRLRGHLLAELDPLKRPRPPVTHVVDLAMIDPSHFTTAELDQLVDSGEVFEEKNVRLRDMLGRLRRTYCHHIGVEYMHLLDSDRRRWLRRRMEQSENRDNLSVEEQRHILEKLTYAEGFEEFLHRKYVGAKRFSLEGGESLIPMIDTFLEEGGQTGISEVVIGMAHRGRLNVLSNILGKGTDQIFSEFEGPADPGNYLNRGDVKYHLGFSSDHITKGGQKIHLSLAFNPSHLEVVDPVVVGRTRAKQDRISDDQRTRGCAVLIHGDTAFSGQGLVPETLNLSEIPGYHVGGTVHIVINNQVGFTTEPQQSRSGIYATNMAQVLNIPIFHVNGDDPEACVHAMRLATDFRQKFHTDVVIDLICYRKYGHNEGDEPAFTQPEMYELIRKHPGVRRLYAEQLVAQKRIAPDEADALAKRCAHDLQEAHDRVRQSSRFQAPSFLQGLWSHYTGGADRDVSRVVTGVPVEKLKALLGHLGTVPEGFVLHPKVEAFVKNRLTIAAGEKPLDWAAGEALAFASVLTEGYSVRLTGQDSERGTFTHRHAILHDIRNGQAFNPFVSLSPDQGDCLILNSPLSEMACLGFEYGYSLDYPDGLVLWEAQFGDFANNAQVIIDQFIAAGEHKWRRLSGLVMLLPHGYEGQGPEHSSARLERFLSLCAQDNLQVCYPTSAAQFFHMLRRQVVRSWRKPLVAMTPKSKLRHPDYYSSLEEIGEGTCFQRLIADGPEVDRVKVKRLLLCSGKVYYDLNQARQAQTGKKDEPVGIARLEQLYPFPTEELVELISGMKNLKEIFWVQEEPKNMGAWNFVFPRLHEIAARRGPQLPTLGFIGRAESGSPATGYAEAHKMEQQLIVGEALNRGNKNGR